MKYRIWHNKQKKYFKDERYGVNQNGEFIFCGLRLEEQSNFTVELSTGILDNNGKEIYEGDIVNTYEQGKQQVYFSNGMFHIIKWYTLIPLNALDLELIEVIGTIHDEE